MQKIGLCAISSQNNNLKSNHNISLARYRENCTLNTIMGIAYSNLKHSKYDVSKMGIYNNIDNALSDCKKRGINTLYVTSQNITKDMKANTNGIDVMYF